MVVRNGSIVAAGNGTRGAIFVRGFCLVQQHARGTLTLTLDTQQHLLSTNCIYADVLCVCTFSMMT